MDRLRPVEFEGHRARRVVGHVRDQRGFGEGGSAGRSAVARMVGEEGERAQQLVHDLARLGEVEVDVGVGQMTYGAGVQGQAERAAAVPVE